MAKDNVKGSPKDPEAPAPEEANATPDPEPKDAPEQAPDPVAPGPAVSTETPAPTIIVQSTTEEDAKRKAAYADAVVAEAARIATAGKRYFIVNPGGFIHETTRDAAMSLLKGAQGLGFRMAKADEIAKLNAVNGFQKVGEPLCAPFEPEKAVEV